MVINALAVLKIIFIFDLAPLPASPEGPGGGTDCHVPKEIVGFGLIPARTVKRSGVLGSAAAGISNAGP